MVHTVPEDSSAAATAEADVAEESVVAAVPQAAVRAMAVKNARVPLTRRVRRRGSVLEVP